MVAYLQISCWSIYNKWVPEKASSASQRLPRFASGPFTGTLDEYNILKSQQLIGRRISLLAQQDYLGLKNVPLP
jgi:hypothetical protein